MHVHQTLELPEGYQHFSWYTQGRNDDVSGWGTFLNDPRALHGHLKDDAPQELRLYTQHEIFYEDDVLKHTRSSPNWEGGFVTFSTCKHLMRTYKPSPKDWEGTWIAGLCPKHCENNCLLFAGCVAHAFPSNYSLLRYCSDKHKVAKGGPNYTAKLANKNPRGDLYSPLGNFGAKTNVYDHHNYQEPPNHTRSTEFYKKSPGSKSERPDGKIPKWWRDIEYINHGIHPPVFILSPCFIFSKPMVWTSYDPKRAALKLTCSEFKKSLSPG